MLNPDIESKFKKTFNLISPSKRRLDVFRDFIKISALFLYNVIVKSGEIENEFSVVRNKYSDEDYRYMQELFQITVEALEQKLHDFFGNIYMSLDLGDSDKGQYFTPFPVSKLIANIVSDSNLDEIIKKKGYITLSEPACGSGGMIISFCQTMIEKGYNPQTQLWVECIDIDPTVAMMCYVQLSLTGVPAKVSIGDALTLEVKRVFYTPFHFLGDWSSRFRLEKTVDKMKDFMTSINDKSDESKAVSYNQSLEPPLIETIATKSSIKFDKKSQISLF